MKSNHLVAWLSPLAIALLAFGSQIALAQGAAAPDRAQVRAEVLQARQSGDLERQRITSYSPNADWGPGAPVNTSAKARRAQAAPAAPASPAAKPSKDAPGRKAV